MKVFKEFEDFHLIKFDKPAKVIVSTTRKNSLESSITKAETKSLKKIPVIPHNQVVSLSENQIQNPLEVEGSCISSSSRKDSAVVSNEVGDELELKPLEFPFPSWNTLDISLINAIKSEIIQPSDIGVTWNDVIGLDNAKQSLREACYYPINYPQLFDGIIVEPWKAILLYGLPGTGKTLLAKAVASESKCRFFNISPATMVSKWRGESEKLVRILFEVARHHSPSIIFIDEIDSLMSKRGTEGEHEGSRRLKTEILTQMDGLKSQRNEKVIVLGGTNLPWDLDNALLRRFEQKIYVDLPNEEGRERLIQKFLPKDTLDGFGNDIVDRDLDYKLISKKTKGLTGSDIKIICKEALMIPLRKVFSQLDDNQASVTREKVQTETVLGAIEMIPCSYDLDLERKIRKWSADGKMK